MTAARDLAHYLHEHLMEARKSLVIGENSTTPRSHTQLKTLAYRGSRRSTLCRIIRALVIQAETNGRFLVFNGSSNAVPQQAKLLRNVKIILTNTVHL